MTTDNGAREEMRSAYGPSEVEERIYRAWEEGGFFKPQGGERPFTVIMPPPNLTGELHMGHALTAAVEDALIRWHRMLGDDTVWVPGVDHAAIAVNAVVERQLDAEGVSRHDIGREAFLGRVWAFVNAARGAHRRAAPAARRLGGLGSRGVHARRGAPARRPPDLREPLRGRPDLPRRADDQLGHRRPDRALRPRGRVPRRRVLVLVRALHRARRGGRADRRLHRDRDDTAGDDPGRHRRRRAPRGRALASPDRAHGAGADLGPPDPGDRGRGDRDRGGVRCAQGDARPRSGRLRDRRAARAGDDQHPRAGRDAQRARRALRRHRSFRGARPRRRGPRGEGADREDRAVHARGRALAAIGRGGGADRLGAVVGERRPAGGAGDRGGARRPHRVRAEALRAHLPALDGEHPRLVHQPPDLVGPSHPRLVLRRRGLRRDHRRRRGSGRLPGLRRGRCGRTRTPSTRGSRRGCGRTRRWAGRTGRPRICRASTRRR